MSVNDTQSQSQSQVEEKLLLPMMLKLVYALLGRAESGQMMLV
jgi:hypothetical protein